MLKLFQNFDFVNSHEALNFINFVMYLLALNFSSHSWQKDSRVFNFSEVSILLNSPEVSLFTD